MKKKSKKADVKLSLRNTLGTGSNNRFQICFFKVKGSYVVVAEFQ